MTSPFETYADLAAWRQAQAGEASRFAAEDREQQSLRQSLTAQGITGHCALCDAPRRFVCPELASGRAPSLRESLLCQTCGGNARQRAAIAALFEAGHPDRVYVTEQASPVYVALRRRVPRLVGSEFARGLRKRLRLSAWLWRKRVLQWVRFADITALGFGAARFDAVLSLDVLEHVPDYRAALREFARVLAPGGRCLLSVPFHADREHSTTLARMHADGRIEHLQPPEYHGDPLSGGVLCFHHFGWDLLAALREAGFAQVEAVRLCDPAQGWPEPQWVLRARR
jgi:SAM-dependent methyltransferase